MEKTPPSRKAPAMEAGALFGNNKTCLGLLARCGSLGLLRSGGLGCARCGSSLGPPRTDFKDLLEHCVTVAGSGGLGQLALQFGQFLFALITLVQFLATLDHVPAFSKKARDQAPQAPNYLDPLSEVILAGKAPANKVNSHQTAQESDFGPLPGYSPLHGTGGLGIEFFGNPARQKRQPACRRGMAHGMGHAQGISRRSDSRV
jgi:hypothetical protein